LIDLATSMLVPASASCSCSRFNHFIIPSVLLSSANAVILSRMASDPLVLAARNDGLKRLEGDLSAGRAGAPASLPDAELKLLLSCFCWSLHDSD